MATAIKLDRVSKAFRIVRQKPFLGKELLRLLLQRPSQVDLHWALRDVSFEIADGEAVGVIGTNGSGKSTLLSLVAKTSYPTSGTVEVEGRIGPLLELGAGFHPDLTGFENIFLNGALLGLTREEIDEKVPSIVEYSGIGEFIHSPVKTYSTGMNARLGFAVIAHISPDILLVDEVLSVGDAEFAAKCQATMREFLDRGTTMFFVSHDMSSVRALCSRAIWIDRGAMRAIGPADEVCSQYEAG